MTLGTALPHAANHVCWRCETAWRSHRADDRCWSCGQPVTGFQAGQQLLNLIGRRMGLDRHNGGPT